MEGALALVLHQLPPKDWLCVRAVSWALRRTANVIAEAALASSALPHLAGKVDRQVVVGYLEDEVWIYNIDITLDWVLLLVIAAAYQRPVQCRLCRVEKTSATLFLCHNLTHSLHYCCLEHAAVCPAHGQTVCNAWDCTVARAVFAGCCRFTYDECCCQVEVL